jgi:hypothetical protein
MGRMHRQIVALEAGFPINSAPGGTNPVHPQANAADPAGGTSATGAALRFPDIPGVPDEPTPTDQLWLQIGQLHQQIVQIEAAQSRRGRVDNDPTPGAEPIPDQGGAETAAERRAAARQFNRVRARTRAQAGQVNDQVQDLWDRIAQIQAQIVKIEISLLVGGTDGLDPTQPIPQSAPQTGAVPNSASR